MSAAIGFDRSEPASLAAATEERARIVEEIQRLQARVAGVITDDSGMKVSAFDYKRQRGAAVSRLTQLQYRAGFLRKWMHAHGGGPAFADVHPNVKLLARCYRALLNVPGEEQLLADIEAVVPVALLEVGE